MTTASFFLCMPDSNWLDLVLIRHGIAEPRVQGLDHPERPLTARGRQRTHAVMEALLGRGLVLDRLISSPYRRALETAQLAVQVGMAPQLELDDRLRPGGSALELVQRLQGRVALVGHEPDLSQLACELIGLAPGRIHLKKAGLVLLHRCDHRWQLQALLRPGLLLQQQV